MVQPTDPTMLQNPTPNQPQDLNVGAFQDPNQLAQATGQGGTAIIQPQNKNSLLGVPRGAGADFAPNSIDTANSIYGPEESRQRTMNKII